eukprot:5702820-Amphidinium_carterae.1
MPWEFVGQQSSMALITALVSFSIGLSPYVGLKDDPHRSQYRERIPSLLRRLQAMSWHCTERGHSMHALLTQTYKLPCCRQRSVEGSG